MTALTPFVHGSEELIIELDKTQAYPSQEIEITIYYRSTFPENEEYDFHEDPINMIVTLSGLVEDIETTDYLLTSLIGTPITSGVKYPAAKVDIHIPNDHGDNGIIEQRYDVYISNLADYCNVVSLKVLSIEETLTIELEDTEAIQGDSVSTTVRYTLLVPSDVTLFRPLNSLEINLGDYSFSPVLSFPGEVVGGQEIALTTYDIVIPEDVEPKDYVVKVIGSPPLLESNHVTINIKGKSTGSVGGETATSETGSEDSSGSGSTGGETDTTDTSTGSTPVVGGEVSTGLSNLSGTVIQGAVSAGAGFGFFEICRRYFGKTSKDAITSSDLKLLREKMKKLPPEPEQPETGASHGEDVLRLPTEDKYQKRDRRRSSSIYKRRKKRLRADIYYRKRAETKKLTPEQESKEIDAAKPKWFKEYVEKRIKLQRTKSYRELLKGLSESDKKIFENWQEWSASYMRRHGAGTVGNLKDGRTAQFMDVAGSRG